MEFNYKELEAQANPGAFSQYDMAVIVPTLRALEEAQYVEIGVDKGRSLSIAKMVTKPTVLLFGIDVHYQEEADRLVDDRTTYIWADSVFVAKIWDAYYASVVQVLFIDGDHSYEGCKRDIAAWYPHMAKKGVLFFHDYDPSSPGVMQAVDEFAKQNNLSVETYGTQTSMVRIQL